MNVIRWSLLASLVFVLVSCGQVVTPTQSEPSAEVSASTAVVGDALTLNYAGIGRDVDVFLNGVFAEQVSAATTSGSSWQVNVRIPAGVSGWVEIDIVEVDGDGRVVIPADSRKLFVGTVLTTLGTDLQSVQDALDAIEPGSAVMIPAGTYSGNEPLGGLVLDNRLLVGRGADETILDGVVNVQAFARTINTAGIADLTLRADYVCLCGADPSEYEPESVSYGDLAGRFLVWNVEWTGNETETMPVFDEETNALITPGEFGGEFAFDDAEHVSFDIESSTLRLYDFYAWEYDAIGNWTLRDSVIYVENSFEIYQEASYVLIEDTSIFAVGPEYSGGEIEVEVDVGSVTVSSSTLNASTWIELETDDEGDVVIRDSYLRSGGNGIEFEGYAYTGSLIIENSTLVTTEDIDADERTDRGDIIVRNSTLDAGNDIDFEIDERGNIIVHDSFMYAARESKTGSIDLETEFGLIEIVNSTIESGDWMDLEVDDSGDVVIRDSTLTSRTWFDIEVDYAGSVTVERASLTSTESDFEFDTSMADIVVTDTTIGAKTRIDIDTDDVGDITFTRVNVTAGDDIEIYTDYQGVQTFIDSSLVAGTDVDFDNCSCGSTTTILQNTTVVAGTFVEFNSIDGGNVEIVDSDITAYCNDIDIRRDAGSISIVDSTLTTVGELPADDTRTCVGIDVGRGASITMDTEGGRVSISNSVLDSNGSVLITDFSTECGVGYELPIVLPTSPAAFDLFITAGTTIVAEDDVVIAANGELHVNDSSVTVPLVDSEIVLASITLQTIDTLGSTFSITPESVTEAGPCF